MPKTTSLAVVMDPIAKIKFAKDSTLAMLLAAASRGWQLTYFEQSDLFLRDGVAFGRGRDLHVFADPAKWFELGEPSVRRLGDFDCVFMRKDPPFDAEYIYTTYILERAEIQGAFVANRPQGLRDMNEKVFTAWFPAVLRAHADHAQRGRHHRLRGRARQDRRQTSRWHGRQVHLRHREGRQEPAGHHRNVDGLRAALRHRAALRARHRLHRGFARAAHRRPASPLRTCTYPVAVRQPRQSGCRRDRRGPRTQRARSLVSRRNRPPGSRSWEWSSSASTSSADSLPRSTSRVRQEFVNSTSNSGSILAIW